jgi:hypothetical protein
MEFKKRCFEIPKLDQSLFSKGINVLDVEEVEKFQEEVQNDEFKAHQALFRLERPIEGFLFDHYEIVGIVLGLSLLGMLVLSFSNSSVWHLLACIVLLVLLISVFYRLAVSSYFKKTVLWEESPFNLYFQKEYKGDIAGRVDPCFGIHDDHFSTHLFRLTVESHPFSKTRFLKVSDPDDDDGDEYYIDYWERPAKDSTHVDFTTTVGLQQ